MAKTHLDQLVDYPAKILQKISADKTCVGLLLNKKLEAVTEDDFDIALDEHLFDYEYVDDTVKETSAYIWVEADVPNVDNFSVKNMRIFVTIACHKKFMKLNAKEFLGIAGNRRDNLVRYVDKLLNGGEFLGIGKLSLESVHTVTTAAGFTAREISYVIPDFNLAKI